VVRFNKTNLKESRAGNPISRKTCPPAPIINREGLMGSTHLGIFALAMLATGSLFAQAPPVPTEYQNLYNYLNTQITSFDAAVNAGWNGSSYPYLDAPQLEGAGSEQYTQLLEPAYAFSVLTQLNALKALGANAVTLRLTFPILYQPFYDYIGNPAQYQQFVSYYQGLVAQIRGRGMKVVVEASLYSPLVGTDTSQFQSYLSTLSWSEYMAGRAANALAVAQLIQPDYMTVLTESDTEESVSGQTNLGTPAGVTELVQTILTTLQDANVTNIQIGAGVGTWTTNYMQYVQALAALPMNFVDMHIYQINDSDFTNALTAAETIEAAGKQVGISECWDLKITDSELADPDYTTIFGRDPFSFWQPIDTAFLQAIVNFAKYKQLAFISPFWVHYFFVYLDYATYGSLPPATVLTDSYTAASDANLVGYYTLTGHAWETQNIPPDTTPPATPAAPTAAVIGTNSIGLGWAPDYDNVGVSAYYIYRDGTYLYTTTVLGYTDTGLASGTTYHYNLLATDASGNVSAASPTLAVQTLLTQTITFGPLSSQTLLAAPFPVSATSTSGLPVSFNSQTTSVCTVSGTTVTLVAVGQCTIQSTQAGNATYGVATPVNESFQVTLASQTITFGALSNQTYGAAPYPITATASSGLPVNFVLTTTTVCLVSGSTVTIVGIGTCTIQATQPGNAIYAVATPVSQSFQVTQGSQTITFGALSNKAYGEAPFQISATASSGLAVSFASTTTTVCMVSGATVTLVGGGQCTIQATQLGNVDWTPATPVDQSFEVGREAQTITFGSLSNQNYGTAPFTVSATATSGLAVSFYTATMSICSVSGSTVTLLAIGTCTIQAHQPGNASYQKATPVSQNFQVTQGTQTITFGALSNKAYGQAPFQISATASSGLAVSFASTTTTVCTVSGTTVTLVGGGQCTIQATQLGNVDWTAAIPVDQSFEVGREAQTITFGSLSNQTYGTAPFIVSATASSGLAVNFYTATMSICSVSGDTVTLLATGTCTIQAHQPGNANYQKATPVSQSFQVTQGSQTITFGVLSDKRYGQAAFQISATASSGLAVSFASTTTTVCTVSGKTITLVGGGQCTIQATQLGNVDWLAATPVDQSFEVGREAQTITFGSLSNQTYGTAPFTVSATASSGLAVNFYAATKSICSVSGDTVTLLATGTCTIQAHQPGNASYLAATPVSQSFQVTPGN
jgi:hypothetical protein